MKAKLFILGLICFALIACEKGIENPYSPEMPEPENPANVWLHERAANYYIDPIDSLKTEWRIWGKLTNIGDSPAKSIKINSKIYDNSWNILWDGSFLFINPASDSSYLDVGETCDFVASWEGLDINIFNEWDATNSLGAGITVTWEDD